MMNKKRKFIQEVLICPEIEVYQEIPAHLANKTWFSKQSLIPGKLAGYYVNLGHAPAYIALFHKVVSKTKYENANNIEIEE